MDEQIPLKQVTLPPGFGTARGSEHEVWFSDDGQTVIKATHAGETGRVFGPKQFASLTEYLERVQLLNEVFGFKWTILGMAGAGKLSRVVSTQPVVCGRGALAREIRKFMEERRFKFHRTRYGDAWHRVEDNLLVSDAEPNNVIYTGEVLVPVDVLICRPSRDLLRVIGVSA